jgi:hypothetical protein
MMSTVGRWWRMISGCRGARQLRQLLDARLDVLLRGEHQVLQFVDDDHPVRQASGNGSSAATSGASGAGGRVVGVSLRRRGVAAASTTRLLGLWPRLNERMSCDIRPEETVEAPLISWIAIRRR